MRTILSMTLVASLFAPASAQEQAGVPDQVRDAVCKTGSYTYDTAKRTIEINGQTNYTSVVDKETPDGRLLVLNIIGPDSHVVGLGYAKPGVNIGNGGTYGLVPVPKGKQEAAKRYIGADRVDGLPIAIVDCSK